MTDAQKLAILVPAVRDLIEAAHKLGFSEIELSVQTKAAWLGEVIGDGPHGIERTSIVETVEMTFDREQDAEAQREDESSVMCWECPGCGDVIPYSVQRPEDHRCTKNKDTNASMIAIPAGQY